MLNSECFRLLSLVGGRSSKTQRTSIDVAIVAIHTVRNATAPKPLLPLLTAVVGGSDWRACRGAESAAIEVTAGSHRCRKVQTSRPSPLPMRQPFRFSRFSRRDGIWRFSGQPDEGQPSRGDHAREPDDRGWVSVWRPLEVFLYDWWPIRNEARLSERLSAMPVRTRPGNAAVPDAWRTDWPAVSPCGERKTTEAPSTSSRQAS